MDGYTQSVRNRIAVDWETVPELVVDPGQIPPEVFMSGVLPDTSGNVKPVASGAAKGMTLEPYLQLRTVQQHVFAAATVITSMYTEAMQSSLPAHILFPQIARIVRTYLNTKVRIIGTPVDVRAAMLAPYYGQVIGRLVQSLRPDNTAGEAPEIPRYESRREPGSTAQVSFWTGRDVRDTVKSHVNYLVADTKKWEQQAAQYLDGSHHVHSWVKNAGLGFGIPYEHDSMRHEYLPDFIVRLAGDDARFVILETKGYDPLADVKRAAAERWVSAVNADASWGHWTYRLTYQPADVPHIVSELAGQPAPTR